MSKKFLGRHIMLKGEYVEKLLKGEKKSTIRKGYVIPKYKEMIVHGGGRPVAIIKITNVTRKRVRELTDEDAKKDGLENKEKLIEELKKAYDDLSEDDLVTIIEFELVKRLDHLEPQDPWMGLKPVEIARLALRYLDNLNDDERKILMTMTRAGSIREAAIRLYGTIEARWRVRRVLKKALRELIERGILGLGGGARGGSGSAIGNHGGGGGTNREGQRRRSLNRRHKKVEEKLVETESTKDENRENVKTNSNG